MLFFFFLRSLRPPFSPAVPQASLPAHCPLRSDDALL